jgi:hypothetical protein
MTANFSLLDAGVVVTTAISTVLMGEGTLLYAEILSLRYLLGPDLQACPLLGLGLAPQPAPYPPEVP